MIAHPINTQVFWINPVDAREIIQHLSHCGNNFFDVKIIYQLPQKWCKNVDLLMWSNIMYFDMLKTSWEILNIIRLFSGSRNFLNRKFLLLFKWFCKHFRIFTIFTIFIVNKIFASVEKYSPLKPPMMIDFYEVWFMDFAISSTPVDQLRKTYLFVGKFQFSRNFSIFFCIHSSRTNLFEISWNVLMPRKIEICQNEKLFLFYQQCCWWWQIEVDLCQL